MVSRNNLQHKMQADADRKPHYGLRKLSVGVASVLLSTTLYFGVGVAHADTVTKAPVAPADGTQQAATGGNAVTQTTAAPSAAPVVSQSATPAPAKDVAAPAKTASVKDPAPASKVTSTAPAAVASATTPVTTTPVLLTTPAPVAEPGSNPAPAKETPSASATESIERLDDGSMVSLKGVSSEPIASFKFKVTNAKPGDTYLFKIADKDGWEYSIEGSSVVSMPMVATHDDQQHVATLMDSITKSMSVTQPLFVTVSSQKPASTGTFTNTLNVYKNGQLIKSMPLSFKQTADAEMHRNVLGDSPSNHLALPHQLLKYLYYVGLDNNFNHGAILTVGVPDHFVLDPQKTGYNAKQNGNLVTLSLSPDEYSPYVFIFGSYNVDQTDVPQTFTATRGAHLEYNYGQGTQVIDDGINPITVTIPAQVTIKQLVGDMAKIIIEPDIYNDNGLPATVIDNTNDHVLNTIQVGNSSVYDLNNVTETITIPDGMTITQINYNFPTGSVINAVSKSGEVKQLQLNRGQTNVDAPQKIVVTYPDLEHNTDPSDFYIKLVGHLSKTHQDGTPVVVGESLKTRVDLTADKALPGFKEASQLIIKQPAKKPLTPTNFIGINYSNFSKDPGSDQGTFTISTNMDNYAPSSVLTYTYYVVAPTTAYLNLTSDLPANAKITSEMINNRQVYRIDVDVTHGLDMNWKLTNKQLFSNVINSSDIIVMAKAMNHKDQELIKGTRQASAPEPFISDNLLAYTHGDNKVQLIETIPVEVDTGIETSLDSTVSAGLNGMFNKTSQTWLPNSTPTTADQTIVFDYGLVNNQDAPLTHLQMALNVPNLKDGKSMFTTYLADGQQIQVLVDGKPAGDSTVKYATKLADNSTTGYVDASQVTDWSQIKSVLVNLPMVATKAQVDVKMTTQDPNIKAALNKSIYSSGLVWADDLELFTITPGDEASSKATVLTKQTNENLWVAYTDNKEPISLVESNAATVGERPVFKYQLPAVPRYVRRIYRIDKGGTKAQVEQAIKDLVAGVNTISSSHIYDSYNSFDQLPLLSEVSPAVPVTDDLNNVVVVYTPLAKTSETLWSYYLDGSQPATKLEAESTGLYERDPYQFKITDQQLAKPGYTYVVRPIWVNEKNITDDEIKAKIASYADGLIETPKDYHSLNQFTNVHTLSAQANNVVVFYRPIVKSQETLYILSDNDPYANDSEHRTKAFAKTIAQATPITGEGLQPFNEKISNFIRLGYYVQKVTWTMKDATGHTTQRAIINDLSIPQMLKALKAQRPDETDANLLRDLSRLLAPNYDALNNGNYQLTTGDDLLSDLFDDGTGVQFGTLFDSEHKNALSILSNFKLDNIEYVKLAGKFVVTTPHLFSFDNNLVPVGQTDPDPQIITFHYAPIPRLVDANFVYVNADDLVPVDKLTNEARQSVQQSWNPLPMHGYNVPASVLNGTDKPFEYFDGNGVKHSITLGDLWGQLGSPWLLGNDFNYNQFAANIIQAPAEQVTIDNSKFDQAMVAKLADEGYGVVQRDPQTDTAFTPNNPGQLPFDNGYTFTKYYFVYVKSLGGINYQIKDSETGQLLQGPTKLAQGFVGDKIASTVGYLDTGKITAQKYQSIIDGLVSQYPNYRLDHADSLDGSWAYHKDQTPILTIYLKLRFKTNAPETKTVTRTITITDPDGKATTITQDAHFSRTSTEDLATKTISHGPWNNDQTWSEYDVPTVDGYTPTKTNVPEQAVTANDTDQTVTITYTANPTSVNVIFQDHHGTQIGKTQTINGVVNGTVDTTKTTVPTGWVIDGTDPRTKDLKLGVKNPDVIVKLKHRQVPANQTVTVTRTIKFTTTGGLSVAPTQVQTATFKQTGTKDAVTGTYTWSGSTPQTFASVASPAVPGYTPNKALVPAMAVTPTTTSTTVTVTYTKAISVPVPTPTPVKATATINYLDDTTGKTIQTVTAAGTVGEPIKFATDPTVAIKQLTDAGYVLVTNDFKGQVFTQGANTFTVHVKHGEKAVTDHGGAMRIIDYVDAQTGAKITSGVIEHVDLTRTGTQDLVTKEVAWGPMPTAQFEAVDSPLVPGYEKPDQATVPAQMADLNTEQVEVKVKYRAIAPIGGELTVKQAAPETAPEAPAKPTATPTKAAPAKTPTKAAAAPVKPAATVAVPVAKATRLGTSTPATPERQAELPKTGNTSTRGALAIGFASLTTMLTMLGLRKKHEGRD